MTLALMVAMVMVLLLNLSSLKRQPGGRRVPIWMSSAYGLFVTVLGMVVFTEHLADELFWCTLLIFALGCVFLVAAFAVSFLEGWKASSVHSG